MVVKNPISYQDPISHTFIATSANGRGCFEPHGRVSIWADKRDGGGLFKGEDDDKLLWLVVSVGHCKATSSSKSTYAS